ncbi:MAG: dockerin type I domain-containing protein [Eubacteriales bacterium]|nr:dockerin type I domain-containing protein [Eubacteriales bacterium]
MRKSKSLLCKVVSLVLVLMLMMATVMVAPFSASAASTYYLRGTFNNWEERSEYALTDNGNGTFSITVTLQAGTHKYKVARDGWNWSVPSQDATLTLAEGGLVKFTMNPTAYTVKAETVTAPTQAIYLRGSFDGEMWPAKEENKLESKGNNCYSLVKTLPAGTHEYKFAISDWTWATPAGDNAKITLSKESQILFEVNALTGAYNATVISGDTKNFYTFDKIQQNVSIQSAWSDHVDQVLCEKDGKLAYISINSANFATANTTWNFIPTEDPQVCYIQNAKTGNYIYISGTDVLAAPDGNTNQGKWMIDMSTGKYRILSAYTDLAAINTEAQNGYAAANYVPAFYLSSQFVIDLDYVYNYGYTLYPDRVEDTKGTAKANSATSITSNTSGTAKTWTQTKKTSDMPVFRAPNTPLAEAVYNLSMEETVINKFQSEFGTAFYTGETWRKVWTRDTAMACEFSLAAIYPEISLNCAKEKVVHFNGFKVFEEDTGTGGSYPVSTDKIITYLSVWEIYLSTGDESVLEYFYDICLDNIKQDYNTVWDAESGLMKGETCGLDWRSQTYPDWMGNEVEESLANIAEGKAASVNMIYLGVLQRMIETADILGKSDKAYLQEKYDALYKAVTERLWHDELGAYAAWEYPSYMGAPLAYKIDCIANGYALWFNIGSQEQLDSIAENYPLVTYGANVVYPNKQGDLEHKDRIYHNRGVWPGWEAQLMLAGAQHGYDELSEEIWNSCITAAATSLVNKEVVDFTTGEGIHVNHQLWSIAATLSGYYKVLFGMIYDTDGITFEPYVPEWMEGPFYIDNYTYCDATIDLSLTGKGSEIVSITVNGDNVGTSYTLPFGATGDYKIDIVVKESANEYNDETVNLNDEKNHVISPKMPVAKLTGNTLTWGAQSGCTYKVWTGSEYIDVNTNSYTIDPTVYGAYSVVVISRDGVWSEMSRPIVVSPGRIKIEAESCTLTNLSKTTVSGKSVVTDTFAANVDRALTINVNIEEAGQYLFWACYNDYSSNDPTSCSNAAIRSVFVDGKDVGALVFPVVNYDFQTSTHLLLDLTAGAHTIVVKFDKANYYDTNMSQDTHTYGSEQYRPDNNVQYDYFVLDKADNICTGAGAQYMLGDADGNGAVVVMDATLVQRAVAKLAADIDETAADVYSDGEISVVDATYIQRYVAKFDDGLGIGTYKNK